jgi:undecaprenyl-diphosphatase
VPPRRWLLVLGVLAFAAMSVAVATGAIDALDRRVLAAAQTIDDPRLDLIASIVGLGGTVEVTGIIAIALAIAWTRREGWRGLAPLLIAAGVALELAMKVLVPHAAPESEVRRTIDLGPFVEADTPFSYPSGHLFRTTFLALIVGVRVAAVWRAALALLVFAMFATRLYLGEHWFSDVAGGVLLGVAVGAFGLEVARRR